ncbi:BREX system ATP-binding domain-containing protein [Nostoc sphaeroides]|uniref:ATP-binding protein n=1 Tax=Nostoc sphaeroides CCNUC1 TaxID=2653204 RepID=A0A5P8WA16_9NOSO|nr:BREX system ATP-binding domain-containing protein [Nostoc sphaeroides]QFS49608.1 hypothetical protein GXM_07102 [Nostoc sphaeroides CCNUC1]
MSVDARRLIESLRSGIPPEGHVRYFTVGRLSEITELTTRLQQGESGALLLKANYGSGKSHLLRFIRETALKEGFAVSTITLDAKSAVRFNRMDQILGAIWQGLEVPNQLGNKGVYPFFDWICQQARNSKISSGEEWQKITNKNYWNYSKIIESPAIFIAIRAWFSSRCDKNLIQDWLYQKSTYKTTYLYHELVNKVNASYRYEFSLNGNLNWTAYTSKPQIFSFSSQGYIQSWAALRDIKTLACAAGLRGLIILFDEFEDILSNIPNIGHQEIAFQNLFQFFIGKQFQGTSFFAVTPEFIDKCKFRLFSKNRWDSSYFQLDNLPTFEMTPLDLADLQELAKKVKDIHGIAYEWNTNSSFIESGIISVIQQTGNIAVQDRTRQTIRAVISFLDEQIEEN